MDKNISARFFRVTVAGEGVQDFHSLLLAAVKGTQPGDREREIAEGVTLRLENCDLSNDYLRGEFSRIQTEHLPPSAYSGGLKALQDDAIAHQAAFIYHLPTRALLLQNNLQSATPSRISAYLSKADPPAFFAFTPILREDAWERFKSRRVRSYTVRFAAPENLDALDDPDLSVARAAKLIAQANQSPSVSITVGAGNSQQPDLDHNMVTRIIRKLIGSPAQIDALSARTIGDDESGPINFIEDHMKASKTLDLPKNDAPKSLATRLQWMQGVFQSNLPYLEKHFKVKRGDANS